MIASILFLAVALEAAGPLADLDLAAIGAVQPKGRVQDQKDRPVVERLIAAGPSSIAFLVAKLEDERRIEGHVFDYWSDVRVGDVALAVLCDFFLAADGRSPTVPGLEWDAILERRDQAVPSNVLLQEFVAKHGRSEIRRKIQGLLQAHPAGFVWDATERCFKPVTASRHVAGPPPPCGRHSQVR